MERPTFDQLIERCNDLLFRHMYPTSLGYRLEFASLQHRDLVRAFFGGVMEYLIAIDDKEAGLLLLDEYTKMAQEDWLPDVRFRGNRVN